MLRRSIGESVRSAISKPPLARVTTSDLRALRAYSEALRIRNTYSGSLAHATALLHQAITYDSSFGAAYAELAAWGVTRDERRDAAQRAYRFRDRLMEQERLLAIATFERSRRNDEAAEVALRQRLINDPGDTVALSHLSDLKLSQRKWSEAESLAVRGLELGHRGSAIWNAVEAQLAQRRFAAADSTLERSKGLVDPFMWATVKLRALAGRRDYDAAAAFRAEAGVTGYLESWDHFWRLLAIRGRLEEAEREAAQADSGCYARMSLWRALWAGRWRGRTSDARGHLEEWLAVFDTVPVDEKLFVDDAIVLLAESGLIDEARRLYAEWEASGTVQFEEDRHRALGAIAAAEGHLDSAVSSFLRWNATPFVSTSTYVWNRGLFEAAAVLDGMGNIDSAAALYEQALALPTMQASEYEADWYPVALRRLGDFHESLGHRDEAIDYYSQFIDLWKDADPELQPQVEEARAAVVRLAGGEG
jgi:tetratricopeptide (TPR) repeat protein